MIELKLDDLVSVCGGRLLHGSAQNRGPEDFPSRAVVDSREIEHGDLFFGLPGESVDGSEFANEALRAGAWGVVVSAYEQDPSGGETEGRVIEVSDPLGALGRVASRWRGELDGGKCKVVGITGSVGKTSTKDILAALLSTVKKVHASPENYNTEVGLPLAILSAGIDTECLILEMAMRGSGQIRHLANLAHPDLGLITNIGAVHVELLGTLEAVAEAKAELVEELSADGVCVVPASERLLVPHLRSDIRTITFGADGDKDYGGFSSVQGREGRTSAEVRLADAHVGEDGSTVRFLVADEDVKIEFNFSHRYNLVNATAAVAAVYGLGLPVNELSGRRYDVSFSKLRGEEIELSNGTIIINDCYNANPISMHAALDHLAEVAERRKSNRRVAVLGEMAELGSTAAELHRDIGRYAAESGIDVLVAIGDMRESYADGFGESTDLHLMEDVDQAETGLKELLRDKDAVLVKGSRAAGLERVTEALVGTGV